MEALAEVLSFKNADAAILNAALDAIERILDVGERYNEDYTKMFDECNGIDHLEGLQEHHSNDVYEKTVKIIEKFFGGEENEDENLAPSTSAAGTFEFGISSPKQLFPIQGSMAATPTTFHLELQTEQFRFQGRAFNTSLHRIMKELECRATLFSLRQYILDANLANSIK